MTPQHTRLARQRLWLGITNVGFWVLIAAGGLFWLKQASKHSVTAGGYVLVGLAAVAAQALFDVAGGALLMPAPRPPASLFLRRWFRGASAHTLVLAIVGLLGYASFRLTGGFCGAVFLAMTTLALSRRWVLHLLAGVSAGESVHAGKGIILAAEPADPAFTGGIVGLGRRAVSLLPAGWLRDLPGDELPVEMIRRQWQISQGLPGRGFLLLLLWNLLGASAGLLLFGLAARPPAEALFGHACWMTLWAFGGLLVLPALSRRAVFAADLAAIQAGHDPRPWIAHFPDIVGEDGGSNPAVQTIFYPVPSAALRLAQLERPLSAGFVPGNLARSNLYYSWATFTLLGRAVHCNAGRPALWVFPPSV